MAQTRLGITIGDASGIGPEVILKALQTPLPGVQPIVYGHEAILRQAEAQVLVPNVPDYVPVVQRLVVLQHADDPLPLDAIGVINVVEDDVLDDAALKHLGQPHAMCAQIQLAALQRAMDDAEASLICAIATAPWTKHLFSLIHAPTYGHTEVLAERFDAPHHVMMLAGDRLRVALSTVHVPIQRVSDVLTQERIEQTISTTIEDLRRFYGRETPSVAVCGLNPHAGEHGVMGTEESERIVPAMEAVARRYPQATLSGPYASDTLFAKFRDAQPFDAVVCMYHDQALIPLKLLHFGQSANITLGLPIIRTSVDHGTAYDIAGRGIADGGSMRYAMELAISLHQTAQL